MKAQVLIITADDEFIGLADDLLRTRLQLEMFATRSLKSGTQLLAQHPLPTLLVLDLTLQDTCCQPLELLRQLRAKTEFDKLPILVLTAMPDPEQIQTALQVGANRYLTKAFINNNLISVVQDLIGPKNLLP